MGRVIIPVGAIEFEDGGNTIWVHDAMGGTALRIKTTGKVHHMICRASPLSHADILIGHDVHFCVSENAIVE